MKGGCAYPQAAPTCRRCGPEGLAPDNCDRVRRRRARLAQFQEGEGMLTLRIADGGQWLRRSCAIACALSAWSGCSRESEQSASRTQPLTERFEAAPAPASKLDVGEECTEFRGNEGCASDLCLRVEPGDPERGMKPRGFCTIACDPNAQDPGCPDGPAFRCSQIWPSEQGWFCAPPRGWSSGKATRHGRPVSGQRGPGGKVPGKGGGAP
jgi:hypothetical protein